MIPIEQLDSRVEAYRSMRDQVGADGDLFVADGVKLVERLLDCGLVIESVFGLPRHIERLYARLLDSKVAPEQIFVAPKKVMQQILGYHIHQGLMALARKPGNIEPTKLDDHIVVLNRVVASENVGSILRSAAAFGLRSVLVDSGSCHPYIRRAVRVSLGSVFHCQIAQSTDLPCDLIRLKKQGYTLIGSSSQSQNGVTLRSAYEYSFPERYALVLGNEGQGMDAELIQLCDVLLQIPIYSPVSSLNVASAATALFYQAGLTSKKTNRSASNDLK